MKKQKIIVCINIFLLCLISIMILSQNKSMNVKKKMIKEMSESTQVSDLNTQINQLNKSHTEYANYIQTSKQAIATALTNEGVTTSENDTLEAMANNISQILQARTKYATATAEDIVKDKTAYVNGELVEGTRANSSTDYEIYCMQTCQSSINTNIQLPYYATCSEKSGNLVSRNGNIFTALKPCKVQVYQSGYPIEGTCIKKYVKNGSVISAGTAIMCNYTFSLNPGDTVYFAYTITVGWWTQAHATVTFKPI